MSRELNALWSLDVHEHEKSNASDQNSVKQKIAYEDHRADIIATNFVCDQLNKYLTSRGNHCINNQRDVAIYTDASGKLLSKIQN